MREQKGPHVTVEIGSWDWRGAPEATEVLQGKTVEVLEAGNWRGSSEAARKGSEREEDTVGWRDVWAAEGLESGSGSHCPSLSISYKSISSSCTRPSRHTLYHSVHLPNNALSPSLVACKF